MKDFNTRIVGINRISEAGPENKFWPVVFLGGCNLRCPYCLNSEIVEYESPLRYIPINDILLQLDDWGEEGVMISGGEPCLPNDICDIVGLCKMFSMGGRKVGVATNGTFPMELARLLNSNSISYVALDCKFSPLKETSDHKVRLVNGDSCCLDNMIQSLLLLKKWHDENRNVFSEVRTTLYPPFVGKQDVLDIAPFIHQNSFWVLQQYRKNIAFNQHNEIEPTEPYDNNQLMALHDLAKSVSKARVDIRWP